MTSREARTRRRAEERRLAKLAGKAEKSGNAPPAEQSIDGVPLVRFNPQLEHEFPRELQIAANAMRDCIHRKPEVKADGFVSHSGFQSPTPSPITDARFVSQAASEPSKRAEINRLNAQNSTGPKGPQGKLASSRNSFKHGLASGQILIQGEDPAAFEALLRPLRRASARYPHGRTPCQRNGSISLAGAARHSLAE